jgi:hypothetical protein
MDRVDAALHAITSSQAESTAGLNEIRMIGRSIIEHLDNINELMLEWEYARKGPAYLSPIARRLRVVESGPLADLLDDAVDAGRLTDADRNAIMRADVVLTGRRRQDGQDVYLVVEVSGGVGLHDVERAVERAALLEKLGCPVLPVVAGLGIHEDAAALALAQGAWYAQEGRVTPPHSA